VTASLSVDPPDSTGSETFERYCYQAHLIFPHCLSCALRGDIQALVPEYIEDVAVQRLGEWRFTQIKTRDAETGPWTLAALLQRGGGGLRSLFRSHQALKDHAVRFELSLEGPISRNNPIAELLASPGRSFSDELLAQVSAALSVNAAEALAFLTHVYVMPGHPSRDSIVAQNIQLLGNQAPHLPYAKLVEIYDRVVGAVYKSMAASRIGPNWELAVVAGSSVASETAALVKTKLLDGDRLKTLVPELLAPPRALLRRLVEADTTRPTLLEQKLLAGGATPQIVRDALNLRAHETTAELELFDHTEEADARLVDLQSRVLIQGNAIAAKHAEAPAPAIQIWSELLSLLMIAA
jgi:hypothetical protein